MPGPWTIQTTPATTNGIFAGPVVFVSPPNYPTWSVQASSQATGQVQGISAPLGFQGTPPPGDPAVVALQSMALTKGLI